MQSDFYKKKTLMNMQEILQNIRFNSNVLPDEPPLSYPKININSDESGFLIDNTDIQYSSDDKAIEKAVNEVFQENSSSNKISMEKYEIKRKNNQSFKAKYINKKRGRKTNKINKKIHSSSDFDNILRKIQVHFLNFITSLLNDIIFYFLREKKFFRNFNYDDKKNVKHDYVESLKLLDVKTLIEAIKISPKYKSDHDINKVKLKFLTDYSWFKEIFYKKISDIFILYYNNREPLNIINVDGRQIKLSKSTKTFIDLIQDKDNKECAEELTKIAQVVYLNNEKIVQFQLVTKSNINK
jgi:hypothetical protein